MGQGVVGLRSCYTPSLFRNFRVDRWGGRYSWVRWPMIPSRVMSSWLGIRGFAGAAIVLSLLAITGVVSAQTSSSPPDGAEGDAGGSRDREARSLFEAGRVAFSD